MRAILTWHSLDPSGSPISVTLEEFRHQVEWLKAEQVRVVDVAELLTLGDDVDAAAITFDDGFVSTLTGAVPVLQQYDYPSTCFIVTGHVGGDNRWGGTEAAGIPVLPLLDWDGLGRLRDAGVSIAAHSHTHPRLPLLDPASIDDEVGRCAAELEQRLGTRPDGFAYPYGAVDAAAAGAVAKVHRWACTTELRPLASGTDPHQLPRLDMWYFGAAARQLGWGSLPFRTWLGARRVARRLRASTVRPDVGTGVGDAHRR